MHRKIFHIDVNSAYLSWEAAWRLQHGETLDLRDIPSIVGGDVKKEEALFWPSRFLRRPTGYKPAKPCIRRYRNVRR